MALKDVGALWLKSKGGRKFFSGTLQLEGREGPKLQVFVFKNEKKAEGSKQPDYRIVTSDGEDDRRQQPDLDEDSTPF